METAVLISGLASVLAAAGPIIFAVIGETITERAGITNLSLNGMIILSAMGGFAAAYETNSVFLGFVIGGLIGAFVSLIVAFSSITLKQSQVAVGFVLTLACRDLAYFLGVPYMNQPGPRLQAWSIPLLKDIPILGPLLFQQDLMTYLSYILIILSWIFIFRTRPGLTLQGIGERPAAAFVRGADVKKLRYIYALVGGAFVGLAGPAYSLNIKGGWMGIQSGLDGMGWIALAITIFGGWNPIRAAFGSYLFAFLQWLGLVLQSSLPNIPSQVLQVAPFPLMILTLLLVNIGNSDWVNRTLAGLPEEVRRFLAKVLRTMNSTPPASLGIPFENE